MRIRDWSSDVCSSDLGELSVLKNRFALVEDVQVLEAQLLAAKDAHDELAGARSEEHTSELQSLMRISYAVFCLKKKIKENKTQRINHYTLHKTITQHPIHI